MSLFLGIDTSNYTTSTALYDSETGEMRQQKKLLPVKEGQLGLRQSDAVFHHTAQLHPSARRRDRVRWRAPICRVSPWEKTRQKFYLRRSGYRFMRFPIRRGMLRRRCSARSGRI